MTEPATPLYVVNEASRLTDAEELAAAEVARARSALPAINQAAFDCVLGRTVRQVERHTEADPVAVLASLVCAAGVHVGPGPHVRAGDDRHPLLVWPLIVGRTSAGRKGASWATARRILQAAAPEFVADHLRSGLTSGEGLAAMFALSDTCSQCGKDLGDSPSDDFCSEDCQNTFQATDGRRTRGRRTGRLPDQRLLVFEPEWAAVMARMRREGNALSATLRAAWEGGDLSTMNVTARVAPESHVGILAHITPTEFRAKLSAAELAGGTYNRFLPLAVARSRFLPLSAGAGRDVVQQLGDHLADRLGRATSYRALGFTASGADAWRHLYIEFGTDHGDAGPVEQFISRSAPNCLRIAGIHAILDGTDQIGADHLAAAAALVRYSIASARAIFNADETLNRLANWIADAGAQGRTRKDITTRFFGGHKTTAEINPLLSQLVTSGRITRTNRSPASGRGRPTEVFTATPRPARPPQEGLSSQPP
jgi:hypothetical protein